MSKLKKIDTNVDFPEAASKHLEDAKILFNNSRFTGSSYLIGYVFECILKSYLQIEGRFSKIHNLDQLSSEASTLALSSPKTARYYKAIQKYNIKYD